MGLLDSLFDGVFGTDTEYHVESATVPVVETTPPSYYVTNIVQSVLNNVDTTFTIAKIYNTGPTSTLKRYIRYAKNSYYYHLPAVHTSFNFLDIDVLQNQLEALEGSSVNISLAYAGKLSNDDNAVLHCYKYHGLNINTLTLTFSDGVYVYSHYSGSNAVFVKQDAEYTTGEYRYIGGIPTAPPGYWYVAIYLVGGTYKFFQYERGIGLYPDLDSSSVQVDKTCPPVVVLKNEYNFIDNAVFPDEVYETTDELLNVMSIPLTTFMNELKSQDNIDQIGDIFFLFGTPILSSNKDVKRYHYEFWDNVGTALFYSSGTYVYTIREERYSYSLRYKSITKNIRTGSIGKIGTVVSSHNINSNDTSNNILSYVIFSKQLTKNTYSTIKVSGIHAVAELPQTNGSTQRKYIFLNDSEQLLIPVLVDILDEEMSIKQQETIVFEAMQFTLYSADEQEVSRLQEFLNSILGRIIIAAVTTWFAGPLGGGAWNLGVTAGAAGLTAFIQQVAISVLIGVVIQEVLMPVLGEENAFLFAIAAVAVSFYGTKLLPGVDGSLTFADYLLDNVSALVDFGSNALNAMTHKTVMEAKDLLVEMEDATKNYEERMQEIRDALDYLNTNQINAAYLVTNKADKYYKNSNNFFKHSLQTNLAAKMKAAPASYLSSTKDPWNTVPQYI